MANTYTDARKLYYEKNKEKINAKARAKRALNNPKVELTEDEIKQKKEKRKQQSRASSLKYYRKNKDLINKKAIEKYGAKPKVEVYPKTEEEIKRLRKEYYLENKERIKERVKKYQLANAEKIKERLKKYYQDNKEKLKKYNNEWHKNNAEYVKKYREENREAYNAKRRAERDDKVKAKEAERSRKWRFGEGREVYLSGKKRWQKNNRDKVNEAQRRGYVRKLFKGLDVPSELLEAKHLQLLIIKGIKNEKCI